MAKFHPNCKLCGKVITSRHDVSLRHRIYCSPKCQADARRGKPLPDQWKKALSAARLASPKCKGPQLYNWKGGKATLNERMRGHRHNRQSKQTVPVDLIFIQALRIAQRNLCFYCDHSLDSYAALEHLTPLSAGGDNQIFNLVWSCLSCNSKKRSQTMEDFAIKTGNLHWGDKWDFVYSAALVLQSKYDGNRL